MTQPAARAKAFSLGWSEALRAQPQVRSYLDLIARAAGDRNWLRVPLPPVSRAVNIRASLLGVALAEPRSTPG